MATLLQPPPASPNKSIIESLLELTQLSDIDPNLFTNARPLWHPPGARGLYGGAVIAQCLSASQRTVPANFTVHSMHCYFVLAGNPDMPITYHVEHVREGKSFCTRTVQARQRGRPIFTTTMSFMREGSGGRELVEHAVEMPAVAPPEEYGEEADANGKIVATAGGASAGGDGDSSPFISQRAETSQDSSPRPHDKKTRGWVKARGTISSDGGFQAHLSALAYISDSNFIGTIKTVHKLRQENAAKVKDGKGRIDAAIVEKLHKMDDDTLRTTDGVDEDVKSQLRSLKSKDGKVVGTKEQSPMISMMVSLDHTIYFHSPRDFRADEWMFTESQSPWTGAGRGLVTQQIFTREGKLIASCVQEGVVRLRQDAPKL